MSTSYRKFALVLLWLGALLVAFGRPDLSGGIGVLAIFLTYTVALFPSDFWTPQRGLPVLMGQSMVAALMVLIGSRLQPYLTENLPWLPLDYLLWIGGGLGLVAVLMALRIGPAMLDEAMSEAERRLGGELGADLAARGAEARARSQEKALAEAAEAKAVPEAVAAPEAPATADLPVQQPDIEPLPEPAPAAAQPAAPAAEPAAPAPATPPATPAPGTSARDTLAALAAVSESALPTMDWEDITATEEARWGQFNGTIGRLGELLADPETDDNRIEALLDRLEHSPDTVEELRLSSETLEPEDALRLQLLLIARPWVAAEWIPGEEVLVLLVDSLDGAGPQSHRGLAMAEAWRGRGGRLHAGERELLEPLAGLPSRLPPGRIRDRLKALLARLEAA